MPDTLQKRSLWVIGVIDSFPVNNTRGVSFTLLIDRLDDRRAGSDRNKAVLPTIQGRLKLGWYYPKKMVKPIKLKMPRPGERWKLLVQLKQPSGFRNEGSFDYEQWLFKQKIVATGYVKASPLNRKLSSHAGSFLLSLRFNIDEKLKQAMRYSKFSQEQAGLIRALALGERGMISRKQWQVLRNTGTAHLVAISGLHIGLAAGFIYAIIGFLWGRITFLSNRIASHKVAAGAALFAATLYAALAGFAIPTQRALVMTLVIMTALMRSQKVKPGKVICIALFAVLLIDPIAIMDPGFWLSFSAVAFIFFSAPLIHRQGKIIDWVGIQFLLMLCLAPLTITFFQTVSLVGPIANAVVLPIISVLVVPLVLFACILLLVSQTLASWLLLLAGFLLHVCWIFLDLLSTWFPPTSGFSNSSMSALFLAFIGLVILLLPWAGKLRIVSLFLLLPLLGSSLLWGKSKLRMGEVALTVLDSGQGLAIVIRTANHVLVYDVGAKYSDSFDVGSAVVVPFLRSQGVSHIDWMIISHKDNDHRGGFESVAKSLSIGYLLSGSPASLRKFPAHACYQGQYWVADGIRFTILHPEFKGNEKGNNRSCVLHVQSTYGDILLTGDIHRDAEQGLYTRNIVQADILLVPHHGSKTSSSWAFLRKVKPKLAIVSAGFQSRFNHPAKLIRKRYTALNIPLLNTAQSGAIEVILDGRGRSYRVKKYRVDHRRYWHRK